MRLSHKNAQNVKNCWNAETRSNLPLHARILLAMHACFKLLRGLTFPVRLR
jgi:hypothetical protein